MPSRPKHYLVFSAGGGFGAWQAGALLGLYESNPRDWTHCAGASVGALNAAVLCQYPVSRTYDAVVFLSRMWRDRELPGMRRVPGALRILSSALCCFVCSGSMLNRSWLDAVTNDVDWDAVWASDRQLIVGITPTETAVAEFHTNGLCQACANRRHTPQVGGAAPSDPRWGCAPNPPHL